MTFAPVVFLKVAIGQNAADCFPCNRRGEFLRFLDTLVAQRPGKELHLVLDNLSVQRLKKDYPWQSKKANVHFHFTPTHASRINQIEAWYGILGRNALKHASFRSTSTKELIAVIEKFTPEYDEKAQPFQWTKISVTQKTL
ncbi:MAG: IS630 family transposase, partial [Puniceicoccaceae bacterium]